jgi:hypothetical protein
MDEPLATGSGACLRRPGIRSRPRWCGLSGIEDELFRERSIVRKATPATSSCTHPEIWRSAAYCFSFCTLVAIPHGRRTCRADEHGCERLSLPKLCYVDRQPLPAFEIGGQPARIHTQGLFVTDRYFYVTGRLQQRPKRPLLVRFDRANPSIVDHIDLLIASGRLAAIETAFDHPGGFDCDGESFWIPVAVSRPKSKSLIMKVRPEPGRSLSSAKVKTVFQFDDHIGAIAFDSATGRLCGANWDARTIYVWKQDGTLIDKFAQTDFLPKNADRAFAIQDWKGLGSQSLLVGALDKSARRRPVESKAVLQLIDMGSKCEAGLIRLTSPPYRDVLPTQEGMAAFKDHIFFLPADLGTNAEVFRYGWSKPLSWAK